MCRDPADNSQPQVATKAVVSEKVRDEPSAKSLQDTIPVTSKKLSEKIVEAKQSTSG